MPDPIKIPFEPDLTAVYAALGKLRSDAASAIRIGGEYVGPGINGGGGAPSAASVAAAGGPATFGNLNGAQVYTSGLIGPGIGTFTGSSANSFSMSGYSASGGGGGDFQRVASVLQSAALELKSAAMQFRGRGTPFGGSRPEFLNASDVVEEAAEAGPAAPSRSRGGRYGNLGFVRSPRGLLFSGLSRLGAMTGGGMMGAIGGIGVGMAGMALYGEEMERAQFSHELTMQAMGGATQSDILQSKLSQIERFNRSGLGLAVTRASEMIADNLGINPGGAFTAVRDEERGITQSINAYHQRDFLHGSNRIDRGITTAIDVAAEVNPYARRRTGIRAEAREASLDIEERYNQEEERYNDTNDPTGNFRRNLENQKWRLVRRRGAQRDVELDAAQRDENTYFRGRGITSEMTTAVSGYLQQHNGEAALYAELAGKQRAFRATEAQTYDLDTFEGRNARNKAYGAIGAQAGQQLQAMADTGLMARADVGAQSESIRAELNASSPAMGRLQGNLVGIMRGAELNAYGTSMRTDMTEADKAALEKQQIGLGELQLQQFKQSIYASGHGQQINSINQQALNGAGSADIGQLSADFKAALAELRAMRNDTSKIGDAIRRIAE